MFHKAKGIYLNFNLMSVENVEHKSLFMPWVYFHTF